jgi:hypothetical protein
MDPLAPFPQGRHNRAAGGEGHLVAAAARGTGHRQSPGQPAVGPGGRREQANQQPHDDATITISLGTIVRPMWHVACGALTASGLAGR